MQKPPFVREMEVRYRDLDTLGHVNNSVFLEYFEEVRFGYWWEIARIIGVTDLSAGDIPGAQYVVAETTLRFLAPIMLQDKLLGTATMRDIGNRSFSMDFDLRVGETFETGTPVATGSAAHVFYDPLKAEVRPRPDWLLSAISELEEKPEGSFLKKKV